LETVSIIDLFEADYDSHQTPPKKRRLTLFNDSDDD
jgi:hypothetical protein